MARSPRAIFLSGELALCVEPNVLITREHFRSAAAEDQVWLDLLELNLKWDISDLPTGYSLECYLAKNSHIFH
jgi:hypothetical protein